VLALVELSELVLAVLQVLSQVLPHLEAFPFSVPRFELQLPVLRRDLVTQCVGCCQRLSQSAIPAQRTDLYLSINWLTGK